MSLTNEIGVWNYVRGNVEYKHALEYAMLREEVEELLVARTPEDEADALADIIFVAIGSLYKLSGTVIKTDKILKAVIDANNKKGKDKVNGKVVKPDGFVGPEGAIRKILNDGQTVMNFGG